MFNLLYLVNSMDEALGEDRVRKRREKPEAEKKTERKVKPVAPKGEKAKIDVRDPNHAPDKQKVVFHSRRITEVDEDYEDDPTLGWAIDYKA